MHLSVGILLAYYIVDVLKNLWEFMGIYGNL